MDGKVPFPHSEREWVVDPFLFTAPASNGVGRSGLPRSTSRLSFGRTLLTLLGVISGAIASQTARARGGASAAAGRRPRRGVGRGGASAAANTAMICR